MKHKTFDQAIEAKAKQVAETIVKKQHDYGKKNILNSPFGPEIGIIVRLQDKISRLANLYRTGQTPANEALRDTWLDIVGYGMVGMMITDDEFLLPLKGEKDGK